MVMLLYPFQAVADLFTQAIFFGLYIPTFAYCLRWLLFENEGWKLRPYKQMTWPFIIIAILIFGVATVNIGITFQSTHARMVGDQPLADVLSIVGTVIKGITLIVIDAVLIFRCWTVYGKSWRVVFLPLVFWTCTIACAITWTISNYVGSELINTPRAISIIVGVFYACNFATNVYASSAIVYRVWKTAMSSDKHSRLYEIIRTISGTGVLYSFTSLLSVLATFWATRNSFPLVIFNSVNFPTACIAYNLVIIRVGQLRASPRGGTSNVIVYNSSCPPAYIVTGGDSGTLLATK